MTSHISDRKYACSSPPSLTARRRSSGVMICACSNRSRLSFPAIRSVPIAASIASSTTWFARSPMVCTFFQSMSDQDPDSMRRDKPLANPVHCKLRFLSVDALTYPIVPRLDKRLPDFLPAQQEAAPTWPIGVVFEQSRSSRSKGTISEKLDGFHIESSV